MKLSQLRKKSNQFVKNIQNEIAASITDNADLIKLQRDQLLASTLHSGGNITPDYDPDYAAYKRASFPSSFRDGRVNLFLTGNLFKNISVDAERNGYKFDSSVGYMGKLKKQYTTEIFGIAPKNRPKAQGITTKVIAKSYRNKVM